MIWGEFVSQIRSLHADFIEQFQLKPAQILAPAELNSEPFPYPANAEDYGEWNPPEFPEPMNEALELHPVERVLLEGPLLPIQEVKIENHQWTDLQNAILDLEKEFLRQTRMNQPEKIDFIEKNLNARFMQLQRRAGRLTLKAL